MLAEGVRSECLPRTTTFSAILARPRSTDEPFCWCATLFGKYVSPCCVANCLDGFPYRFRVAPERIEPVSWRDERAETIGHVLKPREIILDSP